jgi:plasmid stabilization system protein ParE
MYKVKISKQADSDIENIITYIALDNPYRAVSFAGELISSVKSMLSSFPTLGKKKWGARVLVCRGYYILYRINDEKKEVYLLRVINPANYTAYHGFN